ncbi:protein of unknown function [Ralstonia solanacearum CMR15]|nr:protein of unknown function [Ralstonia solanacearum CMR15]
MFALIGGSGKSLGFRLGGLLQEAAKGPKHEAGQGYTFHQESSCTNFEYAIAPVTISAKYTYSAKFE